MPESGVGGAEDGTACHVFSSSNHEYPNHEYPNHEYLDLYDAVQSRATDYAPGCLHSPVSPAW